MEAAQQLSRTCPETAQKSKCHHVRLRGFLHWRCRWQQQHFCTGTVQHHFCLSARIQKNYLQVQNQAVTLRNKPSPGCRMLLSLAVFNYVFADVNSAYTMPKNHYLLLDLLNSRNLFSTNPFNKGRQTSEHKIKYDLHVSLNRNTKFWWVSYVTIWMCHLLKDKNCLESYQTGNSWSTCLLR